MLRLNLRGWGACNKLLHLSDRLLKSHHQGPGDDAVADIEFCHPLQGGHRADVEIGQAVPGVQSPAKLANLFAGAGQRGQFRVLFLDLASSMGIAAGVEFDGVDGESLGRADLGRVWIEKQADGYPRFAELIDSLADTITLPADIEASFRGHFLAPFRDKRHLIRPRATADGQHVCFTRQFEIQLDDNGFPNDLQVAILNVPPVFPQMERDAIGTAELCQHGRPGRIGLVGSPRLADGGDVIDVDAKVGHGRPKY